MTTPDRTLDQRRDALERANAIRTTRATLKRKLKPDRELRIPRRLLFDLGHVSAVVAGAAPDSLDSMKVYDLLIALPGIGKTKANKVLKANAVSPSKTLGGLSDRQRVALRDELVGIAAVRDTVVARQRGTITHTERPAA